MPGSSDKRENDRPDLLAMIVSTMVMLVLLASVAMVLINALARCASWIARFVW